MDGAEELVRLTRLRAVEPLDGRGLAEPDELAAEQRRAVGRLLGRDDVVLDVVDVEEAQRAALLRRHHRRRVAGRRRTRRGHDARARRAAATAAAVAADP